MKVGMKKLVLNTWSPLAVLLLWEGSVRTGLADGRFLPLPTAIFADIYRLTAEGVLAGDLAASLVRVVAGMILGGLPAVVLGILMARSPFFRSLLYPLVVLTYPLPKIALIPFIILLLGLGEQSKIAIVALGAFYLVLLNTWHGVSNIDRVHFEVAKIGRYRQIDIWRFIIVPGAMPAILHGFRLAVGICLVLVVAAEFIGSSSGIGYRIWVSWEMFQLTHMFSALFVLAALGWLFNAALERMERALLPWRK